MKILIENLVFDTIIGILDFERRIPQKVQIDCTILYQYTENTFINYAEVVQIIENTMNEHRFELIETALEELAATLKDSFSLIDELTLTLRKPDILSNCSVGVQQHFVF